MPWYGIIIHNIFNIHITRFYGFFILKLPLSVPMSVFMLVKQTVDPFKTLIFYPPNVFSPPFWQTLNSLCILSLFLTLKETKKNLFPLLLYFLFMTKLSAPKCIAVAIHCSQIVLFTAELLSSVVGSITCNWRHCFKMLFIASWERRETLGWNCVSHTHTGDGYEMDDRKGGKAPTRERAVWSPHVHHHTTTFGTATGTPWLFVTILWERV